MESTNHIEKPSQHTIPEGWREFFLGELGEVKMCKRVMKHQTLASGEIPFYKIGTFGGTPDAYISRDLFTDFRSRFSYPKKGDILLSAAGTIGRTVVFDGEDSYFQDSNIVWIDNKEDKVLNSLLYYCYKVMKFHTENGGIVVRLYNENLRNTTFCAPESLEEQKRIAEALSAVDNMIATLDEAIAKKQQIKEGLMQQLLTGKTRLPGFTRQWSVKKMWEITAWDKYFNEVDRSKQAKVIKYPYLLAADLTAMALQSGDVCLLATGDFDGWTTTERAGKYLCEGEVVSIPWGGYANIKYTKGKFVTADNRIATSLNTNVLSNKYLYYYMLTNQDLINSFYRGAGIQHPSMQDVLDMDIRFPSIEEQQTIVMTLSVSEDEIKELKKKREKYTLVKQGMMQDLLTGKTRLL